MAFIDRPKPDHVHYVAGGVSCENCGEFTPGAQEWCLSCGSNALAVIESGSFGDSGPPQVSHPHWVEIDPLTGRVGYTRLTRQELKAQSEADAKWHKGEHERQRMEAEDLALLRQHAGENPAFAVLMRRFGIK